MKRRLLSGKHVIAVLFIFGLVTVFSVLSTPLTSLAEEQVIIAEWGGALGDALKKAYYDPFEKETGIKVVQASGPDPAKTKAMVDSGNVEWDVIEHSMTEIGMLGSQGYFEPIDYSYFDEETRDNLAEVYRNKFGVGGFIWCWVLAYSTEAFTKDNHPSGWADFWNVEKFPGPRSLESGSGGDPPPLEMALLADGVTADKVYPIDTKRGFESLTKIRPHIVKWWTGGAQPGQMLVDGEVVLSSAFSGRIVQLRQQGAKVDLDYNQGISSTDYWVVPKGAPNKENAMKLVAFMSRAEPQAEFAKAIPYGPVNGKAYEHIDDSVARMLPSHPDNLKNLIAFDHDWWAENRMSAQEMWEKWVLE
jgi:putative spermidine/putrescine transport system substrate-binding protein